MQGQSDSKFTNKTEFMRYLNEQPEAIALLDSRLKEYRSNTLKSDKFGYWLRVRYLTEFGRHYHLWWLKRPELFASAGQQKALPV